VSWESICLLIGAVVNGTVLIGGLVKLSQISNHVQKTFDYFAIEHEILIRDYCQRNNLTISDLPTRLGKAPWWPTRHARPK
jgi:hypothetical protein